MNKFIISIIAGLLLPIALYASEKDAFSEENMEILTELGLPLPGSGIQLVPRAVFNLTQEELNSGLAEEQEMKTKGYIEEYSVRPQELINFQQHANLQFKAFIGNDNQNSTHIRSSLKELKLGFNYKPLPNSVVKKVIGFAPQGGLHKEGWSGVVEFFDAKDIGICAYSVMDVAVSHTAIRIAIEDADYSINNKLTLYEVRGNKSNGFVYKAKWFDEKTYHELECANINYSGELSLQVIELAKLIDINS